MISHVHLGNGNFDWACLFQAAVIDTLAGGRRSESAPDLRPRYHAHYHGAHFRDLDGNKFCVCCHQPEPA